MSREKLSRIVFSFFISVVLMAGVCSLALASKIDPELEAELEVYLADLDDGNEVSVIIEMLESANLSSKRDKPSKLRALRDVASKSQKKLIQKLEKDKRGNKVREYRSFWIFNGLAVTATKAEILELAAQPGVKEVRRDKSFQIPPFKPSAVGDPEWGLEKIQAPRVWDELGLTGAGIVVGSIDTGVDVNHPDLAAQYRGGSNSWFDPIYGRGPEPDDVYGHGTHTVGTMCGRDLGGSAIGVAPNATWIAARGLDDSGWGTSSELHACFQFMADPDGNPGTDDAPDVVNSSWGNDNGASTEFLPDVQALNALGIFTVFSNGNNGSDPGSVGSPASYSFGVGATNIDDVIADFSSRGPSPIDGSIKPDVCAPGVSIRSSIPGGGYGSWQGTSMAAPHVTGAIALLLEADPSLGVNDMADLLKITAVDLGTLKPDNDYGWGRIDVYAAASMVAHAGTLAGTVKDAVTGLPLDATVTLLETGAEAETQRLQAGIA